MRYGTMDEVLRYFAYVMAYPTSHDVKTIETGIELDIQLSQATARLSGDKKLIKKTSKMSIENELNDRKEKLKLLISRIDFYEIVVGKADNYKVMLLCWVYDLEDSHKFHMISLTKNYLQWSTVIGAHTTAYNAVNKNISFSYLVDFEDYVELRNELFANLEDKYNDSIYNLTDGFFDY